MLTASVDAVDEALMLCLPCTIQSTKATRLRGLLAPSRIDDNDMRGTRNADSDRDLRVNGVDRSEPSVVARAEIDDGAALEHRTGDRQAACARLIVAAATNSVRPSGRGEADDRGAPRVVVVQFDRPWRRAHARNAS